jgi:hypothetical protein
MRFSEYIEVKQNLIITARERGKIVARREGHNIWLNTGREFLAQLISLQSFSPDVPVRTDRIKYMGVGIGGTAQKQLTEANSSPISPPYSGSNVQDDITPTVTTLERPVRISGGSSAYPGTAGDVWVGTVQAPADTSASTSVTFRRVFTTDEVSYGSFSSVPLSEIGLFTSLAVPNNYLNTAVAYDTFDTISKTAGINIEAVWSIRF